MSDKKGEFTQESMIQRVGKTHISKSFNDLSEMDFADYAGKATFLHFRDIGL